jgi:hypothetical protein
VRLSASGTGEPATVNEATIIKTIELPYGQEWALYADANVIVLSPCLDNDGRRRAIDEVCAHWRQTIPRPFGAQQISDSATTQPLASLSAVAE